MKAFILALSMIAFVISGYFFVNDLNNLTGGMNQIIYMSLLLILMLICVVGIMINVPLIVEEKRRMKSIVYKKLSKAAMKNNTPEFSF